MMEPFFLGNGGYSYTRPSGLLISIQRTVVPNIRLDAALVKMHSIPLSKGTFIISLLEDGARNLIDKSKVHLRHASY